VVEIFPFLIPITALMIPIVAILVRSQVGRAFAAYLESKAKGGELSVETLVRTEKLFLDLDDRLRILEKDVNTLRDDNRELKALVQRYEEPRRLGN
jgi:hypothetical protein